MGRKFSFALDVFIIICQIPLTVYLKKLCYNRNSGLYKYFLILFKFILLSYLSLKHFLFGAFGALFCIIGKRLCIPAITGGIGAGKSTLGKYLDSNGFYVIDSDSIGRQFLVSGTLGYKSLLKRFGNEILGPDGEVDKAVLRQIVYSDPSKRKLLNKCLHKYIIYKIIWEVIKYRILSWQDLIVIEVPLLYETHLSWVCGPIIVCSASEETRLHRCRTRNSEISKDMSQTPYSKLLAWGDVVIENESTLEDYYKKAEEIMYKYLV